MVETARFQPLESINPQRYCTAFLADDEDSIPFIRSNCFRGIVVAALAG
jgi:hypothetical protein